MKKIFTSIAANLLLVLTVLLFPLKGSAQDAISFTLRIDNAERISVFINSSLQTIQDGDNLFEDVVLQSYVMVQGSQLGGVKSIVRESDGAEGTIYSPMYCSISGIEDGDVWVITTQSLEEIYEEMRTESLYVNVNIPEGVNVYRNYESTPLPLVAGENILKFMDYENIFQFEPVGGYEITEITQNGKALSMNYGYYAALVYDGDVINITVVEASQATISFVLNIDNADNVTVEINNEAVEIQSGENAFAQQPEDAVVKIIPANGAKIESVVRAEDEFEIEGDADGIFTIAPAYLSDGDQWIVTTTSSTGINAVSADQVTYTVVNLDGTVILRNAASIDGLGAGIYIINGKKAIIKR